MYTFFKYDFILLHLAIQLIWFFQSILESKYFFDFFNIQLLQSLSTYVVSINEFFHLTLYSSQHHVPPFSNYLVMSGLCMLNAKVYVCSMPIKHPPSLHKLYFLISISCISLFFYYYNLCLPSSTLSSLLCLVNKFLLYICIISSYFFVFCKHFFPIQ